MMVFDHLRNKGVDDALFTQVFAPIGLDIGAETPEEIAVSIVAELIQRRNWPEAGQEGLSMRLMANDGKQRHRSPDHHEILFG